MRTKHLLFSLLLALMAPFAAMAQEYIYGPNEFDDLYFPSGLPSGWTTFNNNGTGTVGSNGDKLVFTSTELGSVNGQSISMFGVKMNTLDTDKRIVKVGFKLKPSAKTSNLLIRVVYFTSSSSFTEIATIAGNNALFNSGDLHDPIMEASFSYITELPKNARIGFVMAASAINRTWTLDNLYVQDVVPTGLQASNISYESVDLHWNAISGISQWQLEIEDNYGMGVWSTVATTLNNSYTLTGLEANKAYRVRVAAKKSNYISSYSVMSSFRTLYAPVEVGRNTPFEESFDYPVNWTMANWTVYGDQNYNFNKWTTDGSVLPLYDGVCLSISNETTSPQNEYNDRRCAIYTYKSFTFTNTGTYNFKYFWKNKGESEHDYLRVALLPADDELNGGPSPYEGLSYNTLPEGWIALDGGSGLCQTGTPVWTEENHQYTFTSSTVGTYKVAFIWVNDDNGTVNNPPAAVDDFSITDASAYPPYDLQLTNIGSNTAGFTWTHSGFDTEWLVRYKKHSEGSYTDGEVSVIVPEFYFAGHGITLEADTEYDVQVKGNNPYSGWTDWSDRLTFTTMCDVVNTFPSSYYFEGDECVRLYGNGITIGGYGAVNCLKYEGSSGESAAAVLNLTNILSGGIWVSFDWRYSSDNEGYDDGVQLQYANSNFMDDAMWTNAGEFVPRYGATTGWVRENIFLPDMSYGQYCFRLKFTGAGGGTCYLDNLTIDMMPNCPVITDLAVSETYNHRDITLSWIPGDFQTEWQVVYSNNSSFDIDDVTTGQINVVTEPQFTMQNLSYESTYRAWVRGNCTAFDEYGDWEMISFKPTQFIDIALNDGTSTNTMVPVNPVLTNTDDMSMSQFILPQESIEDYEGRIKGLRFYTDADAAVNFTGATFAVYLRETTSETFASDEFVDWTTMQRVYNGPLSVVQEGDDYVMDIAFTNSAYYFDYSGQGNLIIGVKQTVKGTDATAPSFAWYGVETSGYASIGMDDSGDLTRCQFLPKVQITEKVMDMPCPSPSNFRTSNVTHCSVTLSWVPGLDETSWMLKYNKASMDYEWTEVTVSENPYTLTGLSNNTSYDFQLRASCGGDEYSYMVTTSVTTALGNTFVTDGDWDDASNWSFNEVPSITDEVYIEAAAVVPSGCVAEADKINVLAGGLITIADGGQMKSNNTFVAVVEKNITGYGAENVDGNSGYQFIATPADLTVVQGNIIPRQDDEFLYDQIDLYWFNGYNAEEEWYNTKYSDGSIDSRVVVSSRKGYLYARQNDGTLSFGMGYQDLPATNEDINVPLTVYTTSTAPLNGWNLIGNPFTCNAYLLDNNGQVMPYYKMNDTGDAIVKVQAGTPIKPCEGVLVLCPDDDSEHIAVFTTTDPGQLGDMPDDVEWLLPAHNLTGSQPAYIAPVTVTQTMTLTVGWNWISTYIAVDDPVDMLDMLKESLGGSANQIQSFYYTTEYDGEEWFGDLDDEGINNEQMYMIFTDKAYAIELEGAPADVSEYEINIRPGWNWIGFPSATPIDVADAMADFEAEEGDQIQSKYYTTEYDGEEWFGDLETFTPGEGLLYYSNSPTSKTLIFQTGTK